MKRWLDRVTLKHLVIAGIAVGLLGCGVRFIWAAAHNQVARTWFDTTVFILGCIAVLGAIIATIFWIFLFFSVNWDKPISQWRWLP